MKHARVTHGELRMLRRNVTRTITYEKHPGVRRPALGAPLEAYAPLVRDETGEVAEKRETVRCVIETVEDHDTHWTVTYRAGVPEAARFLRARPGRVKVTPGPHGTVSTDGDADYTTSTAQAAAGEPECVPESWDRHVERVALATMNPRSRRAQRIRPTAP